MDTEYIQFTSILVISISYYNYKVQAAIPEQVDRKIKVGI